MPVHCNKALLEYTKKKKKRVEQTHLEKIAMQVNQLPARRSVETLVRIFSGSN